MRWLTPVILTTQNWVRGLHQVWGQSGLHSEVQAILDCRVRFLSRDKRKRNWGSTRLCSSGSKAKDLAAGAEAPPSVLSLLPAGFSFCSNRVPWFSGSGFFNAGITDQCHPTSFLLLVVTENRVFGLKFTFSALTSGHRARSITNNALLTYSLDFCYRIRQKEDGLRFHSSRHKCFMFLLGEVPQPWNPI